MVRKVEETMRLAPQLYKREKGYVRSAIREVGEGEDVKGRQGSKADLVTVAMEAEKPRISRGKSSA
jgi:hypothetical protein